LGYTGAFCDQQITPSSMTINKVIVYKFPATDTNGNTWDSGSNLPDPYITISAGNSCNTNRIFETSNYTNVPLNQILVYSESFTIENIQGGYVLCLIDDDGNSSADDPMVSVDIFSFYNDNNGFPSSFVYGSPSEVAHFEVFVTWNF